MTDIPPHLYTLVKELVKAGYSVGTWRNLKNQASLYVKYNKKHSLSSLSPSKLQIMGYLAYLFSRFHRAGTVNNYISGARTYVRLRGGNTKGFKDVKIDIMKKGIAKKTKFIVKSATPLSVNKIKKVINKLHCMGKDGYVYIVVTLVSFFSLLRQSNLVVTGGGEHSHTLRRQDVVVASGSLQIRIRSSKTAWSSADSYWLVLPRLLNSPFCPVKAWERYARLAQIPGEMPAFWTRDGAPLTAIRWLRVLRATLEDLGYSNVTRYTLHSLRRGGVAACAKKGINIEKIREAGRWKSDAYKSYVPKRTVITVPAALGHIFG